MKLAHNSARSSVETHEVNQSQLKMLKVPHNNKESHQNHSQLTSNERINESGNSPGIKQNMYGDDPLITNQENSA